MTLYIKQVRSTRSSNSLSEFLVTGGKGFLGQHLVSALLNLGASVRIFARGSAEQNKLNKLKNSVVFGDIRDPAALDQATKGVDVVIHLVSNFRKGGSDKREAYAVNVEGTQNVLDAALKNGVKHLIHCSTIGVHGDVRSIPADENTPFNPGDLYQKTKLQAEMRVWHFYEKTGLPTTVIRPISMFGPGDFRMLKLFKLIKKGRFVVVGNGKALFQPAYIDDVVQGFLLCINNTKAVGQVFIIGGEEYVSLNELFSLIAEELMVSPPKLKLPLVPVLWLAALCEQVCVPLGVEPPLHRRRVRFFQNNRAFSIKKAKKILGFDSQVSLREGIQRTIRWYEDNGWL